MNALELETRLWEARAAVGQDLDRLTAAQVELALRLTPENASRVSSANAASRFLLVLVNRVAQSTVNIEEVAALFKSQPFTHDFAEPSEGLQVDGTLRRLRELGVVTEEDIVLYRRELDNGPA